MRRDAKIQKMDLKKQEIIIKELEIENLKQDHKNVCSQIKTYPMKICKYVENGEDDKNDKNDNDINDDEGTDKLNSELDNLIMRRDEIEREMNFEKAQIRLKEVQIRNLNEKYKYICWRIKRYPPPTPIYFLLFKK